MSFTIPMFDNVAAFLREEYESTKREPVHEDVELLMHFLDWLNDKGRFLHDTSGTGTAD